MKNLIYILLIFSTAVYSTTYFSLKKEVVTTSEKIYLGDLVDSNVPDSYKKVFVAYAPIKTTDKEITAEFLTERLLRNGYRDYLPKRGEKSVIVNKINRLGVETQKQIIRERVKELLGDKDYVLEFKSRIRPVPYPDRGEVKVELQEKDRISLSGTQLFTLRLNVGDKLYRKVIISTYINIYDNALVSSHRIKRNERVTQNDVVLKRVDVTGFEDRVVSSIDDLDEYRSKKYISSNRILKKNYFEKIPDIEKGTTVNLHLETDALKLSFFGEAMSDGYIGKTARFKSIDTGKVFSCEIVDSKNALVRRQ